MTKTRPIHLGSIPPGPGVSGGPLTHESSGVGDVGADLAIDLDESLHADLLHLIPSQGVLEAVPQENDEGQALPQLVGTGGRTGSLEEPEGMSRVQKHTT